MQILFLRRASAFLSMNFDNDARQPLHSLRLALHVSLIQCKFELPTSFLRHHVISPMMDASVPCHPARIAEIAWPIPLGPKREDIPLDTTALKRRRERRARRLSPRRLSWILE